jgi:hypothetical protein
MLCVFAALVKNGVQRESASLIIPSGAKIAITLSLYPGLTLYNVIVAKDTFICVVSSHL